MHSILTTWKRTLWKNRKPWEWQKKKNSSYENGNETSLQTVRTKSADNQIQFADYRCLDFNFRQSENDNICFINKNHYFFWFIMNSFITYSWSNIKVDNKKMHGVGFEPTSIATPHLECGPLDRSGIRAGQHFSSLS